MATQQPQQQPGPETAPASEIGGRYANYALSVLVLVYVFNFLDRQIITVLAEDIKRDLGLSDADIGFLYGTAFAVFYAIFGIPLGKVADVWDRRLLISVGLAFWSLMTAASGLARSFLQLGTARIGVGVGEASATPAAFSMLSDYFPPERRTTVLAIYSSGVYIGAGIGIFLGGWILDLWNGAWPEPGTAPFGLAGWQAAFFIVGLPGLLMSLWVRTLREPVRGVSEGIVREQQPVRPWTAFWDELRSLLPGSSLLSLHRAGGGTRELLVNGVGLVVIAGTAGALIFALGTPAQWIALGIGLYAAFCWAQGLALRDPAAFAMIFRTRSLVYACLGFSFLAFTSYGIGAFGPPFFMRIHGVSASQVGTVVGLTAAAGGWLGITMGGLLCDRLRPTLRTARIWLGVFTAAAPVPFAIWMLTTDSVAIAYVMNFIVTVTTSMWAGGAAATVQDLVMPRMRAIASASYILVITFVGLALGPYTVGRISVATDDLPLAMMLAFIANGVALAFLLLATRSLSADEDSRLERARAAGEPV